MCESYSNTSGVLNDPTVAIPLLVRLRDRRRWPISMLLTRLRGATGG